MTQPPTHCPALAEVAEEPPAPEDEAEDRAAPEAEDSPAPFPAGSAADILGVEFSLVLGPEEAVFLPPSLLVGLGSDFTPPLGTSSLAVQTIALSTQVRKSS